MMDVELQNLLTRWARAGVLFNVEPASATPDLEQLLVDTAKCCPRHARLLTSTVTWLVAFGHLVDADRLEARIAQRLAPADQAVLGLILDLAIHHGGAVTLVAPRDACAKPFDDAPLFDVDRENAGFAIVARRSACPESLDWRRWAPPVQLHLAALRSSQWVRDHNANWRWERVPAVGASTT